MEITDPKVVINGAEMALESATFKDAIFKPKFYHITSSVKIHSEDDQHYMRNIDRMSDDEFLKLNGQITSFNFQTEDKLYHYVSGKVTARMVDGKRHVSIQTESKNPDEN